MKRTLNWVILPCLLGYVGICSSCKNTLSDIGSEFFQSHSNIATLDTVVAEMQTVYLDSVPTAGTGAILVGNYEDQLTGKVNVYSYFTIGAPGIKNIDQKVAFDSLCLILRPNKYYAGDTTRDFHFTLHRLDRPLEFTPILSNFYNTTYFSYAPTSLGAWSGKIYPHFTDSITIRLPDQLGNAWMDAITGNQTTVSTDNLFITNLLAGLVLKGDNNSGVVGFAAKDSSTLIRMYYHNINDVMHPLYNDFQIAQTSLQFNHVDVDRNGTLLEHIGTGNKLVNSRQTNNQAVLQPLTNLAVQLDFPGMSNWLQFGSYTKILSAQLIIKPVAASYSPSLPLPPQVSLCPVLNYYTVVDSLTSTSGLVQHGDLVQDFTSGNSYYTYDLTNYLVNEIVKTNNSARTKLLLTLPPSVFNQTLQKLVISNQSAAKNPSQVHIQMLLYKE